MGQDFPDSKPKVGASPGDLAKRIHNWFQLIPKGFPPSRVEKMLAYLQCGPEETVLDPFAGEGTTIIECQLKNIHAYGIELNPFIYFVCKAITNWQLDASRAKSLLGDIEARFEGLRGRVNLENLDSFRLNLPPIDKPLTWWREDVLVELLILKQAIEETEKPYADFFLLALADALVPDLTNVKLDGYKMFKADRAADRIDVLETFLNKTTSMLADLRELNDLGMTGQSGLFNADATHAAELKLDREINCVITCPPYPERYSYTWVTMPHLYLFGYIDHPRQASNIDESSIGGTWGNATFNLAREEIKPAYPVIESVVGPLAEKIRKEDKLTANFVMKYFNLLAKQIMEVESTPHLNLRAAYHVGHSRLQGVLVETDVLLAQIFEGLKVGYKVPNIQDVGHLFEDTELRESIVYAWKE
jgi:hypothetical protein